MENNIPTAEEFLSENTNRVAIPWIDNDIEDNSILAQSILHCMIEFAKLHVKEARKQFKIVFSEIDDPYPFERNDKLSDVYPLTNIK